MTCAIPEAARSGILRLEVVYLTTTSLFPQVNLQRAMKCTVRCTVANRLMYSQVFAALLAICFTQQISAQNTIGSAAGSTIISRDVIAEDSDTFQTLAKRELGSAGFAAYLAEFNGLVPSAPLVSGNIVRIPILVPSRGEYAEVLYFKGDVRFYRPTQPGVAAATPVANSADAAQSPTGIAPLTADEKASASALSRDTKILTGDIIFTTEDGYASISFSSGSIINLQPNTEAALVKLNCLPDDDSCFIEIITQSGKVTSDVENRDDQPVEFKISTPFASAAVRGTKFDIEASEQLILGVTEGGVDVSSQGDPVQIPVGFGTTVSAGENPSDPIELLPAPILKRLPARIAQGDTVSWWSFNEASSYNAIVSDDEGANAPLAVYNVQTENIEFQALDSGDYFLTLRAIDDNGLRGFRASTRVTLADIDASIEPVETSVSRQGREFLVVVENGSPLARGYEIQISGNSEFSDPLSVDVNENGSAVFRLDNNEVFTRARVLIDPYTVSAFGNTSSSR